MGATKVIAVSTTKAKLDSALKHGADVIINNKNENLVERILEETHGIGVGAVIETTGNQKVINETMEILQVAGRCVFVGMIDYPLVFDKFMKQVVYKEIELTGIFGRRMYETWDVMTDLLEYRKLDLADYVGAELPLSEFKQAVEMFPGICGRIILHP
jgi:threonine 3-dehydrogenase